jgi:hypothetical protein
MGWLEGGSNMGWLEVVWLLFICVPGLCICFLGFRLCWRDFQRAMLMTCQVCGYEAEDVGVSVHITHCGVEVLDSKVEYRCDPCSEWAAEVT